MDRASLQLDLRILCCVRAAGLERWEHADLAAPFWRFYWNRNPGGQVGFRGGRVRLGPDRFLVIPPETAFSSSLSRPVDHLYIHFLAGPPYRRPDPGVLVIPAPEEWRRQAEALWKALAGEPPPARTWALANLLVCLGLSQVPEGELDAFPQDPRLQAALRLIERRLDDPPRNRELAREAHLAENAFIRLFQARVGRSPQAHSRQLRVEHACVQLLNSGKGLEEIALECGFCDRYHFSRVFRRLRGMGPAAYRRAAPDWGGLRRPWDAAD